MTEKQMATWQAAVESRLNAMQGQIDEQDARIGNLVENNNLLMGDRQRLEALLAKSKGQGNQHPSPVAVASAGRSAANVREQERRREQGLSTVAE